MLTSILHNIVFTKIIVTSSNSAQNKLLMILMQWCGVEKHSLMGQCRPRRQRHKMLHGVQAWGDEVIQVNTREPIALSDSPVVS